MNEVRPQSWMNLIQIEFKVLDTPNDPDVARLFQYWNEKRGTRAMPSRADIDPADLLPVLPHIFLVEAVPAPDFYRYRIHGTALADFHGRDFTGLTIRETIPPEDAETTIRVFNDIVASRKPLCASGPVFWCQSQEFKCFESCNLPLSADGDTVNMIFGAIKFLPVQLPPV